MNSPGGCCVNPPPPFQSDSGYIAEFVKSNNAVSEKVRVDFVTRYGTYSYILNRFILF